VDDEIDGRRIARCVMLRTLSFGLTLALALTPGLASGQRPAHDFTKRGGAVAPLDRIVRLRAEDISVAGALTELLFGTGVDILFSSGNEAALVPRPQEPRQGSIIGIARDMTSGVPLVGVSVAVLGTRLSGVTGADGGYAIQAVPAGTHRLRARLLGYAPADTSITVEEGQQVIVDFRLEARPILLDEIVAVGYGAQRKEEITGAVSNVTSRDVIPGPARDAGSLIAGRVPGLVVNTPSGDPRAGTEIFLRGITTIEGSRSPLVLVDGVPGALETVAPGDIESISVLKDGSAAAIYGSRAQNGVLLITTKKHAGGTPTLRYEGYASQQRIYRHPEFLTAADYRTRIRQGYAFEDFGHNTDWQDLLLREPLTHVHNLTLTGGAANTNYTASLSYENTQGIFLRSDNEESVGRLNIRHSMFDDRLHTELNVVSRAENQFTGPNYSTAWRHALIRNPTDRPYDEEGNYQQRPTREYTNPLSLINEENGEREERTLRIHGTVTLRPVDQLSLSLMTGTTRENELEGQATTFRHVNTVVDGRNGTASRSAGSSLDRILELTGTYANTFGGHNVNLVGGYSYQDNESEGFLASNENFPTDLFSYHALETGIGINEGRASLNSGQSSWKVLGFFGRLSYDWNNRFLLMLSGRYEGNSRFGAGHKWGLFPGVSAGWRLSEEGFVRDNLPWINELRLRAGYGVTGVAPNQSYLSLTSYRYADRFWVDGRWVQGIAPARNPNPDLKWEEKHEVNVGVNFALFDSRLSGALDIYRRDTRDLLYNYSVPVPPYLTTSILANVGRMRNEGIEAELSYDIVNRPGLRWRTTTHWSSTRNQLRSLSNQVYQTNDFVNAGATGAPIQTYTHRVQVGGAIGNFYGWKAVDIDANGEWIVLGSAGVPIPIRQAGEADKQILGNGIPKHFLAWNNTLEFGRFDLSVNMRGAFRFQILNFLRMYYENPKITLYNMLQSAFEPAFGKRRVFYEQAYVSYYVEDGDYWKVDNATLGYTFGPGLLGPLAGSVSSARIYISGRNLLTLTGYKGLDPEVPFAGNPFTAGNDNRDSYPTTRIFTAGIAVTF
jgi:TonB-dependent starch-binding outer membrane protein SusC